MCSRPVRNGSSAASWRAAPMAARTSGPSLMTSWPATRAEPEVGGSSVVSMCTVVDLPAPLGPRKPYTSPGSTRRSMPSTARGPFLNSRTSSVASIAAWVMVAQPIILVEVVNYPWVRLSSGSIMGQGKDPAVEAWELLWRLMQAHKPSLMALAQELGLAPMQLHALRLIEPGVEVPMSSLAGKLFCDASNVTGIVDRLEARGLIERRPAEHDRRVKLLVLTSAGDRVRGIAESQMTEPPPGIAALPLEHRRALRDALRAAMASREGGAAGPAEAPALG